MFIYILVTLYGAIFSFIEISSNREKKGVKELLFVSYLFFSFILIFMTAFRENVGNDYDAYKKLYESGENVLKTNKEFGFRWLVYFFNSVGFSYNFFQIVLAFFNGIILSVFFYKKSDYPIFLLYIYNCVFFYVINFSQLRQQIAISIMLLFSLLNNKNIKTTFVLSVILASLFHRSSIVVLFIPGIISILRRYKKKGLCFIFILGVSFIFSYRKVLDVLIVLVSKIGGLSGTIIDIIYYYLYNISTFRIGNGVIMSVLLTLLVLIYSGKDSFDRTINYMLYFFFEKLGFVVNIFQRIGYYFEINFMGIDGISNLVSKKTLLSYFLNLLIIVYYFLINVRYLVKDSQYIIPFECFF